MKLRVLISSAAALGFAASALAVPTLIYDFSTGGVSVDADGQTIVSFSMQSEGRFQPNFDPTELNVDVLDGALPSLNDNTQNVIGWTSGGATAGFGYSGATHDPAFIGVLLETGLTQQDLQAIFTQTSWAAPAGGDSGSFDVTAINVPEPGSLALLGLGGLALLRRRR